MVPRPELAAACVLLLVASYLLLQHSSGVSANSGSAAPCELEAHSPQSRWPCWWQSDFGRTRNISMR